MRLSLPRPSVPKIVDLKKFSVSTLVDQLSSDHSAQPHKTGATLPFDPWLLLATVALVLTGFVMITSASMDVAAKNFGSAGFFIVRHGSFMVLALIGALVTALIPIRFWEKYGVVLLFFGLLLLALVLIPGIGREVNGSRRWIGLGPINLQASEIAKVCMVVFMGGYLVRRLGEVRTSWWGVIKPAFPLALYVFVLIMEPDYGATVVLMGTVMGMIFLGGMRAFQFFILVAVAGVLVGALAVAQPYRLERLQSFTDPWADPFGAGYQLSQAQIAFGRGGWFGEGLGNSVQKLFYLPEAHTDFVYSVLAEELGMIGALLICGLYGLLVARIFLIGRQAEKQEQFFMAYISYGFAFIIAGQAMINIGVNVGALPTKGLTLPLLSYGGSSLLACCGMIAIVQRVDYELKRMRVNAPAQKGRKARADAKGVRRDVVKEVRHGR
ncbi:putative lipid II flippase FtsW [Marinobacterium lutimaris]|uniref:Probable peptidoglycan glycosyltransferase FtsW n=1 Tax=Marinobacterium lutimaris TaxID=568106 RepID=A0A1H6CEJ9_9GAMM|nr:putative lipid II flippase FtsW [Marinobacterium lutimaris]SEG70776.1 cell division-specific peptidoglycan biosynthesis regulator FtsW [Marinobacterium lutimaris]